MTTETNTGVTMRFTIYPTNENPVVTEKAVFSREEFHAAWAEAVAAARQGGELVPLTLDLDPEEAATLGVRRLKADVWGMEAEDGSDDDYGYYFMLPPVR